MSKIIMNLKQQKISVIKICEPERSILFTQFTKSYPWIEGDYTHNRSS